MFSKKSGKKSPITYIVGVRQAFPKWISPSAPICSAATSSTQHSP
jgi:hypothetical protein